VQASLYRYGAGMPNNLMYLSMMMRIYISVSATVVSTCPCQWRGERYDGTSTRTGPASAKKLKTINLKDTAKEQIKIFQII